MIVVLGASSNGRASVLHAENAGSIPVASTNDLHWLAGLLEGEGSFLKGPPSAPNRPVIRVHMTDRDVVERVAELFQVSVVYLPARKENWKPTWLASLTGRRAVALMQQIRPYMGERRMRQIDAALAASFTRPNGAAKLTNEQRDQIKLRFRAGENAKSLAVEFGVTHWNVYAIHQERPPRDRRKSKGH